MKINVYFLKTKNSFYNCMAVVTLALLLLFFTGCDPCLNNPCDDGLMCNGVEICTADGGQVVCSDGTPIECDPGQTCIEPDGLCAGMVCTSDEDCDDADLCTTDTCVEDTCENIQVECPDNESCEPATGECTDSGSGTATTLLEAVGVYTGTGTCGDDDDEVILTADNGTLILSGFTGNDDITLTITGATTATAKDVVAFGNPGHTLTLTLDTETGMINFELATAGSCITELVPISQQGS